MQIDKDVLKILNENKLIPRELAKLKDDGTLEDWYITTSELLNGKPAVILKPEHEIDHAKYRAQQLAINAKNEPIKSNNFGAYVSKIINNLGIAQRVDSVSSSGYYVTLTGGLLNHSDTNLLAKALVNKANVIDNCNDNNRDTTVITVAFLR